MQLVELLLLDSKAEIFLRIEKPFISANLRKIRAIKKKINLIFSIKIKDLDLKNISELKFFLS
jgi:hypothetical protein